ncbi:MAG: hypothetical protein ACOYJV_01785 [Aminivibrio sp.]|jgi:hypothetical protein
MAVSDIRLDTEFFNHPKTVKLERRLGLEGLKALLVLWTWAARNMSSGDLAGLSAEDLEIAAGWAGEPGRLAAVFCELGWLDGEEGTYSLHEWALHNPWAAGADLRSDKARLSRMAATHPHIYEQMRAAGRTSITKAEYLELINSPEADNDTLKTVNGSLRNVNESLTPSPSPSPTPKGERPELSTTLSTELYTPDLSEVLSSFPGYRPKRNEGLWAAVLERDFPGVDLPREAIRARKWAEQKDIKVDDVRAFFRRWLERGSGHNDTAAETRPVR